MGIEMRTFGPPGCGKTTDTSNRIRAAVDKFGSDSVIVASFTKTAAAELAGRGLPIEKEQIGTLHAHCYRAMGKPVIAETAIQEWNEYTPELKLTGGAVSLDENELEQAGETHGDTLYNQYNLLRNKCVPHEMWPQPIQLFAKKWEDWKQATGVIDFTDMIELSVQDSVHAPGNPRIGFFDECQDFTRLEFNLVRAWCEHMDYMVLSGDDDQAIFHFKGASPEAFLTPIPDKYKKVLDQSYRVPRRVQQAAQMLIERVEKREPKVYKPRDEEGDLRLLQTASWMQPEAALKDAERYLADGKTVMFLTTCAFMLDPLKKVLRQEGIPFHNPFRKSRGDWNPITPEKGTSSAQRLLAFLRPDNRVWGDQARLWTPQDLQQWTDAIKSKGILKRGAKGKLDVLPDDVNLSLEDLMEYFEEDSFMQALETDLDWFEQNLLSAKQKPMEFPLLIARTQGAQALRKRPQVILGTMHSVKGGEADVVYLFPDLSPNGMREWSKVGESKDALRRLFYVGLTRTRHTAVICNAATPYHVKLGGLVK